MRVAGESVSRGQGGDGGRGLPAGNVRGGDDLIDGGAEAMVGCVEERMPRQRERIQGLDDSSEEEDVLRKSGGIVGRGRGSDRGRGSRGGKLRGLDDLSEAEAGAVGGVGKELQPRQRERIIGLDDSSEDEGDGRHVAGSVGRGRGRDRGREPCGEKLRGLDDSSEAEADAVGGVVKEQRPRQCERIRGLDDSSDEDGESRNVVGSIARGRGGDRGRGSRRGTIRGLDDSSDEEGDAICAAADKRTPGSKRRGRKSKRMEEDNVPEHVWKRFTPPVVDEKKCLARMWSGGRGEQCKKVPMPGRAVCGAHGKSAPHGLVTGAIPYDKLQEFLKAEESARKRAARGEGVVAGSRTRGDRRKRHWYARYLLWAEAERLDTEERRAECGPMESIDDLGDAEFTECLERVNKYVGEHRVLQHHTGSTSIGLSRETRGQGPLRIGTRPAQRTTAREADKC